MNINSNYPNEINKSRLDKTGNPLKINNTTFLSVNTTDGRSIIINLRNVSFFDIIKTNDIVKTTIRFIGTTEFIIVESDISEYLYELYKDENKIP